MKDTQKELHDDFCILIIFLIALAIGMVFGCFYILSKGYVGAVKQGLDSYASLQLK